MAKLFTAHDKFHVHAILGSLCLFSFVYMYADMVWHGAVPAFVPLPLMLIHTALPLSSLVFTVPLRRIRRNPTLIYEEYRLHAIVFTMRSLCIHIANMVDATCIPRLGVVLAASFAADTMSKLYGESGNTTVRGDGKYKSGVVRTIVPIYSCYQIFASASHIYDEHPTFSGYNTLSAIQVSAFGMTLVRKGVFKWKHHAVVYTFCLALSVWGMWLQLAPPHRLMFPVLSVVAALARVGLGLNKYAMWCAFTLIYRTLQ